MKNIWLMAGFLAVVLGTVGSQSLQTLEYLTEDYPPENYLEDGILKGIGVDLLRTVWGKLQIPAQPIRVLPWARAYSEASTLKGKVLFSTIRSQERETLFKWAGPIRVATTELITLSSNPVQLSSLDQARTFRIGVMIGDVGEEALNEAGFPKEKITRVTKLEQLLGMLRLGRIDFVCTSGPAVRHAMELNPSLKFPWRRAFLLYEDGVYFAFSKDVPDTLVSQFQGALNALQAERKAILYRYGLSE